MVVIFRSNSHYTKGIEVYDPIVRSTFIIKTNQVVGILCEFVRKFCTKRNLNLQLLLFLHKQLPLKSEIESVLLPRKVLE